MKDKTLFIDAFRNIRKRLVSFLSVFFVLMVGCAGILCIFSLTDSFTKGAEDFYTETAFRDLEIVPDSPVSQEDIDALAGREGIADAEGFYYAGVMVNCGEETVSATAMTITERINKTELVSGRLPEGEQECLLDENLAEKMGIGIGDTVTVHPQDPRMKMLLKSDTFTVTGLSIHPHRMKRLNAMLMLLPEGAIRTEMLQGNYTRVLVTLDLSDGAAMFSDAYTEEANAMIRDLEADPAYEGWVFQDRRMNPDYEEIRGTITTCGKMGYFFSPVIALVLVIVCYSTISIMIDDQKKQVGTVKALGFHNRKTRLKYIIFGMASAITGSACGLALSVALEAPILKTFARNYSFGSFPMVVALLYGVVFALVMILLVLVVSRVACAHLLKCSARGLLSGSEPKVKALSGGRKKERKGSLYRELILNNVKTDKARIVVSVTIIAMTTLLIGAGLGINLSFKQAFRIHTQEINKYTLKIEVCGSLSDGAQGRLEELVREKADACAPAYYGGVLFRTDDVAAGVNMLCMAGEDIGTFYNLGSGASDGVTVNEGMDKAYGIRPGSSFTLYNPSLETAKATVNSAFTYPIGSLVSVPQETYQEMYGSECETNCWLVTCDEETDAELSRALRDPDGEFSGYVQVTRPTDDAKSVESMQNLFNIVSWLFVGIAIALDFLINVNLTNILVNRRMRELLVMRVNGFSMKQVTGYLKKETIFTVTLGILLGIAGGIPFGMAFAASLSNTKLTLPQSIFLEAWAVALVLTVVFSIVINTICFRKVRKARLTSITE